MPKEKRITLRGGLELQLKYHLQLKTKERCGGEPLCGSYQQRYGKQEYDLLCRFKSVPSSLTSCLLD